MGWLYNGVDIEDCGIDLTKFIGFVYEIRNTRNNMRYIGRKLLTKAGTKQVKGKKKKIRKPSDWESYYSSSPIIKELIEKEGNEHLERRIIRFCTTLSECSYWETYYIFKNHAIVDPMWYNHWVSARITRSHLMKVADRILHNGEVK